MTIDLNIYLVIDVSFSSGQTWLPTPAEPGHECGLLMLILTLLLMSLLISFSSGQTRLPTPAEPGHERGLLMLILTLLLMSLSALDKLGYQHLLNLGMNVDY